MKYFLELLEEKGKTDYPKDVDKDEYWTEFMKKVMEGIGERMNCYVIQKFPQRGAESGEYLGIDAIFIDAAEYDNSEDEKHE